MRNVWIWVLIALAATGLIAAIFFSKPMELVIPDSDDVEALARMIASENPRDSVLIQTAIAWTAVNEAKRRRKSVADLLMPGGIPSGQNTGGRYASTRNPSTPATTAVAYDVLSGRSSDPTGGAIQFDSPKAQRAALARNVSGYSKSPEQVAASRIAEGKELVTLPGVDPDYMRWWRYA